MVGMLVRDLLRKDENEHGVVRRGLRGTGIRNGEVIHEVTIPAGGRRELSWEVRPAGAA